VTARRRLLHSVLPLLSAICAGMLWVTPAGAQSDYRDRNSHDGNGVLVDHVPTIPATAADYHPITADERLHWFTRATIGPADLVGGLFAAGIGTANDWPHEYGTHWNGFAKRYGMRLTGVVTNNAIEAGLGAAWGEDPRYFQTVDQRFSERWKNVADLTFRAYRSDGERHLAYARFIAIFGNNFLSNTWRVPSESNFQHAMIRSGEGFGAQFLSDAFHEFVPPLWRRIRHQPPRYAAEADGR